MAGRSLSDLEALLTYSWRRQVAAELHRLRPGSERTTTTIGFADLVDFTRLSRQLSDGELTALVSRFEERSGNVITAHGGRLIKSLGDEVLFVADAPRAAADIALHFVENVRRRNIPGIRVGLEYGPVITHGGDIYGDTVNLASRLTQVAQPNHILVGPQLAAVLAVLPEFDVESVGMTEVRGFGLIEPAALRRPGTRRTKGTPAQI
ncbi:adenylate/guanylate cyclase domain-containing protein [Mycobacterium sp.]|uniref:adenylate/guanylate cyclase domain-containing protein n=1 Tax=Mycobacterium sp. TaxID=1785 RepID=UPI002D965042|nr:adenylate/guanylate cyclase domain-containing protein [Mycobacterium sp.]